MSRTLPVILLMAVLSGCGGQQAKELSATWHDANRHAVQFAGAMKAADLAQNKLLAMSLEASLRVSPEQIELRRELALARVDLAHCIARNSAEAEVRRIIMSLGSRIEEAQKRQVKYINKLGQEADDLRRQLEAAPADAVLRGQYQVKAAMYFATTAEHLEDQSDAYLRAVEGLQNMLVDFENELSEVHAKHRKEIEGIASSFATTVNMPEIPSLQPSYEILEAYLLVSGSAAQSMSNYHTGIGFSKGSYFDSALNALGGGLVEGVFKPKNQPTFEDVEKEARTLLAQVQLKAKSELETATETAEEVLASTRDKFLDRAMNEAFSVVSKFLMGEG